MSKYVIGIDPDSNKHGVALYVDGHIDGLYLMNLMELQDFLIDGFEGELEGLTIHIEDVASQNFMYSKHRTGKGAVDESIMWCVGMCQQAQLEVERMCKNLEVNITKHKPSKKWKSQAEKTQFKKVTGWTGRSNEDTRSAAYFGYLGL